ncbi:WV associated protein [Cotia virus SPAn232]|uniref:WV associated protein n=2 Tax=Cotia virus TaxID=39444 RepID=H6TA23_9POXV|nr:WV associated protein [Cotia virus SPAn232]ADT91148.1 WV associated protein [Cotia virus SPAn232]AIT70658.1 WV associated protein [Cotia virus]
MINIIKSFKNTNMEELPDNIIDILKEYKNSIVLTRTNYGKGIIIYKNNLKNVESLINIDDLDILGITKYVSPTNQLYYKNNLFIDEKETDEYYSPKTSISPLVDILKKVSFVNSEINAVIDKITFTGNVSLYNINKWLCESGLEKYRFVNYKRCDDNDSYIKIDEMSIMYIGKHYIWVKNKNYNRPEMDILPYNIDFLTCKSVWYKFIPTVVKLISTFVITIHSILTDNGPIIYMITTRPGKTFVNFNPTLLILEFIQWIREIMSNIHTIRIVSFFGSLLDFPLLKAIWPKNSGWIFIDDIYIISDDGLKIILCDMSNFSNGMDLMEYCNYWNNNTDISYPNDFITIQEAKNKIKTLEKMSKNAISVLYTAIMNNILFISKIFRPWDCISFTSLEDILITKTIYNISSRMNISIYNPATFDLKNFIYSSIQNKNIKTIDCENKYKFNVYKIKSLLNIIVSGKYPIGLPTLVNPKDISSDSIYLALCKVTIRRSDLKIPLFYLEDISSKSFYTVLTSVDIKLAIEIGGYKIKEIFILKWDKYVNIEKELISNIIKLRNVNIDKLANEICLFTFKNIEHISSNVLLFTAFLTSYCRSKIHSLICKIDNHYIGSNVIKYNHIEIFTNKQIYNNEFLIETIYKNGEG